MPLQKRSRRSPMHDISHRKLIERDVGSPRETHKVQLEEEWLYSREDNLVIEGIAKETKVGVTG